MNANEHERLKHLLRTQNAPKGPPPDDSIPQATWNAIADGVAVRLRHMQVPNVAALCRAFDCPNLFAVLEQALTYDGPTWYHGTTYDAARAIHGKGFDLARAGKRTNNYGVLGRAVYLTSCYQAVVYGDTLVEATIDAPILPWNAPEVQAACVGTPWQDASIGAMMGLSYDQAACDDLAARMRSAGVVAARAWYSPVMEVAVYDPACITVTNVRRAKWYV